jgi:hypothetical protein
MHPPRSAALLGLLRSKGVACVATENAKFRDLDKMRNVAYVGVTPHSYREVPLESALLNAASEARPVKSKG